MWKDTLFIERLYVRISLQKPVGAIEVKDVAFKETLGLY